MFKYRNGICSSAWVPGTARSRIEADSAPLGTPYGPPRAFGPLLPGEPVEMRAHGLRITPPPPNHAVGL